jgi:hypothetical protein
MQAVTLKSVKSLHMITSISRNLEFLLMIQQLSNASAGQKTAGRSQYPVEHKISLKLWILYPN